MRHRTKRHPLLAEPVELLCGFAKGFAYPSFYRASPHIRAHEAGS